MDPDRAQRLLKTVTIVSFAIAFVTLVGELAGWWNDLGELLLTITTVVGALGGSATVVVGSSEEQVRNVHSAVLANGRKLDKLDKLDAIEDALIEGDGRVSKLDLVQAELDQQTGALDRQVSLLRDIRDSL